jgi:alkaline phosphatase
VPKVRQTLQQKRGNDPFAEPFDVPFIDNVPSLSEMARGALNVLDEDPDGFFLMVEGGAIDWASHDSQSGRMIEEQIAFNKTVEAVVDWIQKESSWKETLLIVTGDHETGYLTGPGSGPSNAENDTGDRPRWNPFVNNGKGNLPGMEWNSGGHTNALIPLYAKGAGSQLLVPCADQTDPVRGLYLDIAELGRVLWQVTAPEVPFHDGPQESTRASDRFTGP